MSINYVAISKDLEKLPPQQSYYIKMKICYDQGCNDIGLVVQRNDAITYFTCSSISRHWEMFFQNRSRELFPLIAASMFVKFKSVIEIFQDEDFMARNTVKKGQS